MELAPTFASALQHAEWLASQGRLAEAVPAYQQVLTLAPQHAPTLAGLGTVHLLRGELVQAMDCYALALKADPQRAETHAQRAVALLRLGRRDEALEACEQAVALAPGVAAFWQNKAVVLSALARPEEALAVSACALQLHPADANGWRQHGVLLRQLQRWEAALESYDQALALEPQDALAWTYRGHCLRKLGKLAEALVSYEHTLRLWPQHAEAHYNRSIVLREQGRLAEALAACDAAVALQPEFADAWWNKAEMLVMLGQVQTGWRLFEWRWRSARHGKEFRQMGRPLWLGEPRLEGKTILLNVDGGLGDLLQFCRYIPLVQQAGAALVVVECMPGLMPLLEASFGPEVKCTPYLQPLPDFDCHCPHMSLPAAFPRELSALPAELPYLRVPQARQELWRQRLGPRTQRLRVGLVWSGGHRHFKGQEHRSIPLEQMRSVLLPGAEYHCLQKEILAADQACLQTLPIHTWAEELHDFADTAALACEMDLILSVDTAVAHLAGALARPVWVLLPFDADMRWFLERTDSPWYPDVMRLFRQQTLEDWSALLETMRAELQRFVTE